MTFLAVEAEGVELVADPRAKERPLELRRFGTSRRPRRERLLGAGAVAYQPSDWQLQVVGGGGVGCRTALKDRRRAFWSPGRGAASTRGQPVQPVGVIGFQGEGACTR